MRTILVELIAWRDQLVQNQAFREKSGELPDIEIDKLTRAIAYIQALEANSTMKVSNLNIAQR